MGLNSLTSSQDGTDSKLWAPRKDTAMSCVICSLHTIRKIPNQIKTKQKKSEDWSQMTHQNCLHRCASFKPESNLMLCGQLILLYKYNKLLAGVVWIALLHFLYCKSKKLLKIFCSGNKGLVFRRFYIFLHSEKKYIDWDYKKQTNWTKSRFGKRRIYFGHITNGSHLSPHVPGWAQPKILDVRCVPDVDSVKGSSQTSLIH